MITKLKKNQVFVFGSNLAGHHIGGAALQAQIFFGAIDGAGEGLMGQSYAFPTLGYRMEKRTWKHLKESLEKFYQAARLNPHKTFFVTKVGCGIAGYPEAKMKKLFNLIVWPNNVFLPTEWQSMP